MNNVKELVAKLFIKKMNESDIITI